MNWWRERKKNQNPWFRVDNNAQTLEGQKLPDGQLLITIKFMGVMSSIKVPRENVEKLVDWLIRTYPRRDKLNVVTMAPVLPLRRAPRDPDTDPQFTG